MLLFLFGALAFSFSASDFSKEYKNPTGDFSIMIPRHAEIQHAIDDSSNVMISYTPPGDSTFTWMLSVSKFVDGASATTMEELNSDFYRDELLKSCNCTIPGKVNGDFAHFKGVNFRMVSKNGFSGYMLVTIKGSHLYAITFQSPRFEAYADDFMQMMNTMKIYK